MGLQVLEQIDPRFIPEMGHALEARGLQTDDVFRVIGNKGGVQMLRLHRDSTGRCTGLEDGVNQRLEVLALGF